MTERQEEDSAQSCYEERLTTLSDIELIRKQSENFVELEFLQIQLEAENNKKRQFGNDLKGAADFQNSISKAEGKIQSVKKEINKRDAIIASRLSLLHRAIEESKVVILSTEFLRESIEKNKLKQGLHSPEEINTALERIVESAKENMRLIKAFAQMNLTKSDWTEAKMAELSK